MSKPPRKLTGRPTFDDRGNSVWKWNGESTAEIKTGRVKALAEGMSLERPSQEPSPDPYNQALSQGKEKTRGRTLDDMRRLNEQIKRERAKLARSLPNETLKPRVGNPDSVCGRRLRLRFGDRELLVDERRGSISIGRAEDNDVIVKSQRVSRSHARIVFIRNKFVLIDQSTNGTFVQAADGVVQFVRGDSLQFDGNGLIGIGRHPKQGSRHTIHFTCEAV